jgi:outer membrane lipoprotein carrier protein
MPTRFEAVPRKRPALFSTGIAAAALLLLGGPATAPAGGEPEQPPGCAEEVALRVQEHYEGVRDLSAEFSQTTRNAVLGSVPGEEIPTRGRVVFAKPGRMRWVYQSPEPSLVVSDGETLWIYDPTLKEVQVLSVDAGFLSGTAIQFLLGEGRILESFRVSAESCKGEEVSLALHPRQEASYERLELRVDSATGAILATAVLDLFGNRTDVVFGKVERNRAPDDALFRFEPSEGDRVLTLPAAH